MLEIPVDTRLTQLRLRVNAALSSVGRVFLGYNQQHLIVCGFPRAGTSLLYNMLSASTHGFRYEPFENYFMYRLHRLGSYATKAPLDVLHIPAIDGLNINRKALIIIVVVRDIRDILTSRHPLVPDQYFISFDTSLWPKDRNFRSWAHEAPGVIPVYEAIESIRNRRDVTIIRYEDLVADPDRVQHQLGDKFNLRFNSDFSNYHKRPEKHAYSYRGRFQAKDPKLVRENDASTKERVSRWRRSSEDVDRIRRQFLACPELFSVLKDYGYETDDHWFSALDP
ncbi:sulfotransferase domain-containing protein [Lentisalinibacter sediminis]|uniref:sulfotransferase domain-containing protein n=1 Tax=Lentisalinibacter sediminis TaxID=2992237 RepID=UPI003869EE30